MDTVTVRLIDPAMAPEEIRIVPALAGTPDCPDGLVTAGQVLRVPADVAGRAPFWRPVTAAEEAADVSRFFEYRGGYDDDSREVHDLGDGLLAQVGVWEAVEQRPAGRRSAPSTTAAPAADTAPEA